MPAPRHVRVIWSGTFGTDPTAEIWSCSVALTLGATGGKVTPLPDDMLALAETLSLPWDTLMAGVSAPTRLTNTRAVVITALGKYERTVTGRYLMGNSTRVNIAGGARVFPNQVALVQSLRNGIPGPTGRGRFYLPLPVVGGLQTDGRMSDAVRDTFVTRLQTFIGDVNTNSGVAAWGDVAIASGGSAARGIAPSVIPINEVGVGLVLDTMRSRQNALEEQPEYAPI